MKQNWVPVQRERSEYTDIQDGQVFKRNPFFKENPEGLQLIIFQDSFEVVNPLGSARVKHKVLGVYYTLANVDARCRSQVQPMQLILLCKEKTMKRVGHEKIFS